MSNKPIRVYKASAGSGKTYTLAAEFIANMIVDAQNDPQAHARQLAITFTKKATAEMKERILQNLWALANATDVDFLNTVKQRLDKPISDDKIRQCAQRLLTGILHNYDAFHVTTIDSFFQSLLTNMAYEVGLSASFKVDLNDSDVLSKGVMRFLRDLNDTKHPQEISWLQSYMEGKVSDAKSWRVHDEMKKLAKELIGEAYLKNGEKLEALSHEDIKNFQTELNTKKAQLKTQMRQAAKGLIDYVKSTIGFDKINRGNNFLKKLQRYEKWDFPTDKDKLFSKTLSAAASSDEEECIGSVLKKADQQKTSLREVALSFGKRWSEFIELAEHNWFVFNTIDASLQHLNPLRLLGCINSEVRNINHENNRFMLAHTPALFDKMVSADVASFVFERAGTQFNHVMIDEFQDTSTLQWSNLQKLIVENIAEGNSCMLVGDVKQSIYRWRGGDWTSLNNMRDDAQTDVRSLRSNFRSGEVIVGFNNAFFVAAAAALDQNVDDGASTSDVRDIYTPQWNEADDAAADRDGEKIDTVQQIAKRKGGFVRVRVLGAATAKAKSAPTEAASDADDASDVDVESAGAVLKELHTQIERLHNEGVPYDKMAILVRRNVEAQHILQHPLFAELPLVSDEAFLLSSSELIRIIVTALRLLASARQTPSADGTSQWVFSDEMSLQYLRARSPRGEWDAVFSQLHSWAEHGHEDLPFYQRVLSIVRLFRLDENEVLVDGLTETGAADLEAQTRNYGAEASYLYAFLDHILAYLNDDTPNLHRFLRYWDDTLSSKSIPSAAAEGISIVTVHKSKGLDFHSLFVPFCDWDLEKDRSQNLSWIDWEKKFAALDDKKKKEWEIFKKIPLLPVTHGGKTKNSIYDTEYEREHMEMRVENLNLLYVAFTRARQNLVVCGVCSAGEEDGVALKKCIDLLHRLLSPLRDDARRESSPFWNAAELRDAKPVVVSVPTDGGDADEERSFDYAVEFGQPSTLECSPAAIAEKQSNPLIYTSTAEEVDSHIRPSRIVFRQSNAAKEFYASQAVATPIDPEQFTVQAATDAAENLNVETASGAAAVSPVTLVPQTEKSDKDDFAHRRLEAQRTGNLLHLAMEHIASAADLEATLTALPKLVAEDGNAALFPERFDVAELRALLQERLSHPMAQGWFDGKSYRLYREFSIISRDEQGFAQTKRPDRVMVTPDGREAIVVDYKTGERDRKNQLQVQQYCQLLRDMGYEKVTGYLWYLYHGKNNIVSV